MTRFPKFWRGKKKEWQKREKEFIRSLYSERERQEREGDKRP
jgi:hypothetical protein